MERWLPIARVDGRYEVSDLGRIRCVRAQPRGRTEFAAARKPIRDGRGYLTVQVRHNGKAVTLRVASVVLTAFVGPRPPGQEVRHLNGVRTNNALTNLAWGTKLENAEDKHRHGTMVRGDRHGRWRGGVTKGREMYQAALEVLDEMGLRDFVVAEVHRRLGLEKACRESGPIGEALLKLVEAP
jgi:hypothetical protein